MRSLPSAAAWLVFSTGAFAQPAPLSPTGRPQDAIDRDRLMAHVARLPTKRAARGDADHRRGLAQTEEHLERCLREMGHEPVLAPLGWTLAGERAFLEKHGGAPARREGADDDVCAARTWHNLIVELPGRELPKEVLVIGAHFDAAPGAPGADDNGSGTAALLELARALRDRPMKRTVRLIFFNLEEIGLKGSAEYVRSIKPRLDAGDETIIGMASLEMLGYFTDEPGSQRSPIPAIKGVFDPPTVGDFIAIGTTKSHAGFAKRLDAAMRDAAPGLKTLTPDFLPDLPLAAPDLLRSDNGPFLFVGISAVMVTDTSNFRNPNYHRRTDTVDTLDPERFTLVVRGLAGAVHEIAGPMGPASP